jgi:hypothetical protein
MIVNGNITANSSHSGFGIGTGEADSNDPLVQGNLTIVSGNIAASSSSYGSGIGTGVGERNGTSVIGNVTASKSSDGPGIGTEQGENMHSISGARSSAITSGTPRSRDWRLI